MWLTLVEVMPAPPVCLVCHHFEKEQPRVTVNRRKGFNRTFPYYKSCLVTSKGLFSGKRRRKKYEFERR